MGLILWFLQRLTAICMPMYAVMAYMYFSAEIITYDYFAHFFTTGLSAALFIALIVGISTHAFIGIWTVATDYIKCSSMRYASLSIYGVILLITFCEAILIVGGKS